jgi:putative heme iron utilization protein
MRGDDRHYVTKKGAHGPILEVPGPLPSGHQALGSIHIKKKEQK